jgi:hypothetical protein
MMDSKASQLLSSVYSETEENTLLVAKSHSMWFVSLSALRVSVSDRDAMIAISSEGRLNEAMFSYVEI